jgi:hypothetical protein
MTIQKKISQLPSLTASTNESLIAVVFSGTSGNTTYQMTIQDFIKSVPFGTIYQNLIPDVTDTYSLGSSGKTFSSVYVGAGTVFIGPNGSLGIDDNGVLFSPNGFASNYLVLGAVTESGVTTTSGVTFTVTGDDVLMKPVSGQTYNLNRQLIPTGGTANQVLTRGSGTYGWGWSGLTPTQIPTRYYGSFTSNVTQTNPVANVARAFSADTNEINNGVKLSENTRFVVINAGVYNIQFSAQLKQLDNTDSTISIWFRKNGRDIPRSNTELSIDKNQERTSKLVASWNFVENFEANDYVEIMWSSPDRGMEILYQGPQILPTRPSTPSLIVTVTQI